MTAIEIVATVFGLACVVLTIRQSIWCWPTGLVMVILYAWIFFDAKLYSDSILQVIYIILQIYGWYYWLRGGPAKSEAVVSQLNWRARTGWVVAGLAGTGALGWTMARWTDASIPFWDAGTTVLSLIAQYLLAAKRIESWVFWIVVDVMAIGIYWTKELYVTSGLYCVFLVLATMGLFAWQRSMTSQPAVAVAV